MLMGLIAILGFSESLMKPTRRNVVFQSFANSPDGGRGDFEDQRKDDIQSVKARRAPKGHTEVEQ